MVGDGPKELNMADAKAQAKALLDAVKPIIADLSDGAHEVLRELFLSAGQVIATAEPDNLPFSTIPYRVEANALIAYCVRAQAAFERAHSEDDLSDKVVREIMLEGSWRAHGWLELRDRMYDEGLHEEWNLMVMGYHMFLCGRWNQEGRSELDKRQKEEVREFVEWIESVKDAQGSKHGTQEG